jgi:hypothetical protein
MKSRQQQPRAITCIDIVGLDEAVNHLDEDHLH